MEKENLLEFLEEEIFFWTVFDRNLLRLPAGKLITKKRLHEVNKFHLNAALKRIFSD